MIPDGARAERAAPLREVSRGSPPRSRHWARWTAARPLRHPEGVPRRAGLALLLVLGCVAPIQERSWLRVETPHFEIVSGASEGRTLEIAGRLELFRAVLARFGIRMNLEPRVPLRIYVFGDERSFARFRPRPGLVGFMLPRSHANFLVVHAGEGGEAETTALHEYVHFVLRNGGAMHYPAWYDEGLSELLSTLAVEDGNVLLAQIPPSRAAQLRYGSPLSLRRAMTATDVYEWSDRALGRFYAQAWALLHFFHVADRLGYPARRTQMVRYLELVNRGTDPDAACEQAFGLDFEGLEREFLRYLGEEGLPYLGVPLSRFEVPGERRTTRLPEHEKRFLLGDLALALGDGWRGEARRWFELAIAANGQDARSHAALGRVLGEGEADAHLASALALGPADPEVHRLVAESLLDRALAASSDEGAELVERARRHFRRSLELAPEQVAAHAGLGRSYLHALLAQDPGALAEGLRALATAHERLPADPGIALALAELEFRAGATESARSRLARMPAPSHGDPVAVAERAALERVRREVGLPASAPVGTRHLEARLEVASPEEGTRVRGGSGWTLVAGRGWLSEAALHDVVVAIDESASTHSPTGSDLDGDGIVGKERRLWALVPDSASSDPEDTVIRAELEAARVLIRQLPERTTRVAIVTFAGRANLLAPLGTPSAALLALERYEVHVDPTGTSLALALAASVEEFIARAERGVRRQRTILLLSDGHPTIPTEREGQRDALRVADQLGEIGIPVHAFALGEKALEKPDFYRLLAERSEGRFVPVARPGEVVSHLADLHLTGLDAVAIRNETSGEGARALRLFPDGSFDGYVPLVEGPNTIAITAALEGGRGLDAKRTVHFERPAQPTPEDRRAEDELRRELETRGLELELLAEIRRSRQRPPDTSRELEIEVERR
jgi:Mg-chelatase subunit ChlD/tetratricopeptide (TPR) repeat protein